MSESLFNDPLYCSFVVKVQEEKIYCSPFVLSHHSEYFRALISGPFDSSVVHFNDDGFEPLFKLLKYLHTFLVLDKVPLISYRLHHHESCSELIEMYVIADRLLLVAPVTLKILNKLLDITWDKNDLFDLLHFYRISGHKCFKKMPGKKKRFVDKIVETFNRVDNVEEFSKDFETDDFKSFLSLLHWAVLPLHRQREVDAKTSDPSQLPCSETSSETSSERESFRCSDMSCATCLAFEKEQEEIEKLRKSGEFHENLSSHRSGSRGLRIKFSNLE